MTATIQSTPKGTAVSGLVVFTKKSDAKEYARKNNWPQWAVTPAYHASFGWKGYVIGQWIDTKTFRGFDGRGKLVDARKLESIEVAP